MAFYNDYQVKYFSDLRTSWQNWITIFPHEDPQRFWSSRPAYEKTGYYTWIADGAPLIPGNYTPTSKGVVAEPDKSATGSPGLAPPSGVFKTSKYTHPNTSFSGTDIVATITPLGGKPMVFAEIQTISYSIYRPIMPVTALGRINPKGVVRGPRTIAGSLIFTVFDRHALKAVMNHYSDDPAGLGASYGFNANDIQDLRKYAKTDEMPPFDISITFLNEYGNSSTMTLYGVYILTEGQTMSIEDMITENTMQFIAMDIDLMDYGASMSMPTSINPY